MGPGPTGWRLDFGLTTPPREKLPVRKPKMSFRMYSLEEVHNGGESPHWAIVPMRKKFYKKILWHTL